MIAHLRKKVIYNRARLLPISTDETDYIVDLSSGQSVRVNFSFKQNFDCVATPLFYHYSQFQNYTMHKQI